jgi:SH3-like domain-containing protein
VTPARHAALAVLALMLVACAGPSQPSAPSPEPATEATTAVTATETTVLDSPTAASTAAPVTGTPSLSSTAAGTEPSTASSTLIATSSPTITATSTSTATPSEPTATAPPSGNVEQSEPEQVEVFGTGGSGANLRAEPGTGGQIVEGLPDGTRLTVVGPDREVDGRAWRNVRGEAGTTGWIVSEVVRSLATPTPTATALPSSTPTSSAGTGTPTPPPDADTAATPTPGPSTLEPAEPTPEPERIEVVGTGAQGANLRAQPGLRGSVLRSVPDGSRLTVVGEDQGADGLTWRNVQAEDGTTGWLAVEVIRTLGTPMPTPLPGAPGVGAPIDEESEPEEEQTEEERVATPCRPGQLKGDAATGVYYPVDHPEYAGLRERVRCFDDASRARTSGFREPEAPEPTPSPSGE